MKFLGLFGRSAAGSAVATFIFGAVIYAFFAGVLPVVPLLVQAVVTGVTFGIFYSLVHIKREPSFLSSFGAGIGYGVFSVLSGILLGTVTALSLGTLIGLAISAAVLGGGAYLATRIGGGAR